MDSIFEKRRSIRKYKDIAVEEELITDILTAGFYAPSAGNEQAWDFVVVNDRSVLDRLANACEYWAMLRNTHQAIIVVSNLALEKFPGNWVLDCAAATQNMLLAIESIGLGGVWLGVYPEEDRMVEVAKIIGADGEIHLPFSIISFGYPDEVRKVEDRFHIERVHYNKIEK